MRHLLVPLRARSACYSRSTEIRLRSFSANLPSIVQVAGIGALGPLPIRRSTSHAGGLASPGAEFGG
jgi:hypothetical protein